MLEPYSAVIYVLAEPMTNEEYDVKYPSKVRKFDGENVEEGYHVQHSDGVNVWKKAAGFDAKYRKLSEDELKVLEYEPVYDEHITMHEIERQMFEHEGVDMAQYYTDKAISKCQ